MSQKQSGEPDSSAGGGPDAGHEGVPRWVKIAGVIGVVVVALVVVMLLSGHGPGRHMQHSLQAPSVPMIDHRR
ncbi:hypothetical protein [Actinoplanes rectilineatus]|uniref:hypothetical protein n=1 Tax=Actinoplanes rectilineatus TaxID=113571 RepID=UPI0005F27BB9|nr:hypothetical protein [Actinoplanes rectilineatus]